MFLIVHLPKIGLLDQQLFCDILLDLGHLIQLGGVLFDILLYQGHIIPQLYHFLLYQVLFVFVLIRLLLKDEVLVLDLLDGDEVGVLVL